MALRRERHRDDGHGGGFHVHRQVGVGDAGLGWTGCDCDVRAESLNLNLTERGLLTCSYFFLCSRDGYGTFKISCLIVVDEFIYFLKEGHV